MKRSLNIPELLIGCSALKCTCILKSARRSSSFLPIRRVRPSPRREEVRRIRLIREFNLDPSFATIVRRVVRSNRAANGNIAVERSGDVPASASANCVSHGIEPRLFPVTRNGALNVRLPAGITAHRTGTAVASRRCLPRASSSSAENGIKLATSSVSDRIAEIEHLLSPSLSLSFSLSLSLCLPSYLSFTLYSRDK